MYDVEHTDDAHAGAIRILSSGPVGVNGPHQTWRRAPFRRVIADSFVFDTTVPDSQRLLRL